MENFNVNGIDLLNLIRFLKRSLAPGAEQFYEVFRETYFENFPLFPSEEIRKQKWLSLEFEVLSFLWLVNHRFAIFTTAEIKVLEKEYRFSSYEASGMLFGAELDLCKGLLEATKGSGFPYRDEFHWWGEIRKERLHISLAEVGKLPSLKKEILKDEKEKTKRLNHDYLQGCQSRECNLDSCKLIRCSINLLRDKNFSRDYPSEKARFQVSFWNPYRAARENFTKWVGNPSVKTIGIDSDGFLKMQFPGNNQRKRIRRNSSGFKSGRGRKKSK